MLPIRRTEHTFSKTSTRGCASCECGNNFVKAQNNKIFTAGHLDPHRSST
uniref:Uncharacterized protein n=1 Tax=Anguilla anguilla TaxID=7936 RepID=A0A0E9VG42_ANGAN